MSLLTFDAEKHEYRLDGKRVPSVTQILRRAGLVDTQWFTETARLRGTVVHEAVRLHCENDLDVSALERDSATVMPYFQAWRAFRKQIAYNPEQCEVQTYHPLYRYAATADQIGTLNGKSCLLEIKTGASQPWHGLQTAAYNAVFKRRERWALMLGGDGNWRLEKHEDERDWPRFLAALTVANLLDEWRLT